MRSARPATLTVEIHSLASGCRRQISTSETARFVGPTFTLTVRIHRVESRLSDRISSCEHAGRVIAGHTHRRNTQGFDWLRCQLSTRGSAPSPGHTPTLTVEYHSASSDRTGRISTWTSARRSMADTAFEGCRRAAIHTGSGSSPDRTPMLTVEIHSAASRFGGRISTPARTSSSFATLRPHLTGTPLRAASAVERPHPDGLRPSAGARSPLNCTARRVAGESGQVRRNPYVAKHAPALTVRMHSRSIGGRSRVSTSPGPHAGIPHARHSARMRVAPNRGNGPKPAPEQAHRRIGRGTHH